MKIPLLISALVSTLIGAVALYVGLKHNAMGEFCRDDNLDICKIDYLYAFGIWVSWFIVSFVTLSVIIYLVRLIINKSTRKTEI